jgi:hypothetical protein
MGCGPRRESPFLQWYPNESDETGVLRRNRVHLSRSSPGSQDDEPLPVQATTAACQAVRTLAAPTVAVGLGDADRSELGARAPSLIGKVRRSLGLARVRSIVREPPQEGGLSERARACANARQPLPCRRSWVRVPSSASRRSCKLAVAVVCDSNDLL